MKSRRHKYRLSTQKPSVTLTPLIDTALTLLIIFMVTTPIMHNDIKVELPQGQAKEKAQAPRHCVVTIDKNKAIFLNGNPVTKETLSEMIQHELASQHEKLVAVRSDKAVLYGDFMEIVEIVQFTEGVQNVALDRKTV